MTDQQPPHTGDAVVDAALQQFAQASDSGEEIRRDPDAVLQAAVQAQQALHQRLTNPTASQGRGDSVDRL